MTKNKVKQYHVFYHIQTSLGEITIYQNEYTTITSAVLKDTIRIIREGKINLKKAKAYLYRLKTLNEAIDRSLRRLEKLRAEMLCTSGMDYSKDRVQVSPQDRLSAAMAEYVDLDAKIKRMIDRYVDHKREVIQRIRGMERKTHREIIFRKFVKFQSVREISAAMKKSKSWIFEKQAEAIKDFKTQYLV